MQNRFDIAVLKVVMEEEKDKEQLVRILTKQRGACRKKNRERKEKERRKKNTTDTLKRGKKNYQTRKILETGGGRIIFPT
jgi:hypothetical protein